MANQMDQKTVLAEHALLAASGRMPWSRYLEELCNASASDKAYIAIHDLSKKSARISYSYNVEDSSITTYNELLNGNNPWTRKESYFQAEGLIWSGKQIVDCDELRRSDFYNLFMAPEAMLHTAHMVLRVNDAMVSELVLTRRPDETSYSEADLARLRELIELGHVAVDVAQEFNLAALAQSTIFDSLNDISVGLATVSEGRRAIRSNVMFRSHMQKADAEGGTVFFQDVPEHAAIKLPSSVVRSIRGAGNSQVILLRRLDGVHPVTVHVWRQMATCALTGTKFASVCMLTLDPQQELVLDEQCLQEGFDLTPAEVRVATGIASCKRIEAIAAELGITPSTARTHLKRIFDKTETRRQSELVRLMGCVGRRQRRLPAQAPSDGGRLGQSFFNA